MIFNYDVSDLQNAIDDRFAAVTSGSFHDIREAGLYYVYGAVTDKPANAGGLYAVAKAENGVLHGLYLTSAGAWDVVYANSSWTYTKLDQTFVVTGTTLASKTNTTFCTTSADNRVTTSTNVANVTFLDPTCVVSDYTATTNSNGTVTLSGTTTSATTTAIIECYN